MLRRLIFLIFIIVTQSSHAQKAAYPCQQSKMGKLITQPLLHNGSIHYELANNKNKNLKDGVGIGKIDSVSDLVVRFHKFNNDSLVELEFIYDANDKCDYLLMKIYTSAKLENPPRYQIDQNGLIDAEEEHFKNPFDRVNAQKAVDSLLDYFK